jgi:hypothetical protein
VGGTQHEVEGTSVSPTELAGELAAMMRTGVTVEACRKANGLRGLTLVRAKAASTGADDLAVAARNLVREACARVDDIQSGPTAVLLGVAAGMQGSPAKVRRQRVADEFVVTADHVRSYREPQLLEAVADELFSMDSAYRLRHRHRAEADTDPTRSGIKIDWVEQHRSYNRIWTPVTALRADSLQLANRLRDISVGSLLLPTVAKVESHGDDKSLYVDPDDWHFVRERVMTLCWRLAQYSWEVEQFVQRDGGLWLLADPEAELQAADAIYRLGIFLPFGEADESVLRLMLTEARERELDPFEDLMLSDERWPIFRDVWLDWVQGYVNEDGGGVGPVDNVRETTPGSRGIQKVTLGTERSDFGRWLAAGEEFILLIERDWNRVAGVYR